MFSVINQTIRIINLEIFNGVKYRLLINTFFLVFILGLQFGDVTLKICSNTIVVIWISINVYYVFSLFMKESRMSILHISHLTSKEKVLLLYTVTGLMNTYWFVLILMQFLLFMNGHLLNTLLTAVIQYVFAITLGAMGAVFYKRHIGLIVILVLGIANLVMYNPLTNKSSSHLFSISEQMHSMNVINVVNILGLVIFSFAFLSTTYILSKINDRHKLQKWLTLTFISIISYTLLLYSDLLQYNSIRKQDFISYVYEDKVIEYRAFKKFKIDEICNIIAALENSYSKIQPDINYSQLTIDKTFLSEMLWKISGKNPKAVSVEGNTIKLNITSHSMINFEEPMFLQNFIEDLAYEIDFEIKGYEQSKYTRHLVKGYETSILIKVCDNIFLEKSQEVKNYYVNRKSAPPNKNNFVHRIGFVVYDSFPDYVEPLYNAILKESPQTDKDFLKLLKDNYAEVFNNIEIQKIVQSAFDYSGLGV